MDPLNTDLNLGGNSNPTIDTSSSINSVTNPITNPSDINTNNYQNPNDYSESQVEEVDLSGEIAPDNQNVFQKAGSWISNAANSVYNTGAEIVNDIKTWASTNLLGAGSTLEETAANLASDVGTIVSKLGSIFIDSVKTLKSTEAVIATSVVSGAAKLVEHFADLSLWCRGKLIEGQSYVAGTIVGLFNKDTGDAIKNAGHQANQQMKEWIEFDAVGAANKWFYECTDLGRWINDNSLVKYDSEVAMKIREVSEKAAEVAAATALTVLTGGAATFAIGALYGIGKQAERTYQRNGTDTSLLQELGIVGSGALTGLSWMANGKLVKGLLEVAKTAAAIGTKQVINKISKDILTKDFWLKAFKDGLTGANGVGNHIASAMMTGEDIIPYLNGEKPWDAEAVGHIALCYLKNLGYNVAEDALRGYLGNFNSQTVIGEFATKLMDNNTINKEVTHINATDIIDNVDVLSSNLEIYSKGVNLDKTAHQVPIEYLIGILKDPDTSSKILAGDPLDEFNGFTRLEIGNAMNDLIQASIEHDLEIDIDEAGIERLFNISSECSGSPYLVAMEECEKYFKSVSWENPMSIMDPRTQIIVKCLKFLKAEGCKMLLLNNMIIDQALSLYENNLEYLYQLGEKLNHDMLDDLATAVLHKYTLNSNHRSKEELGKIIESIKKMMDKDGYQLSDQKSLTFDFLQKYFELYEYDEAILEKLRDFTGGYVPEGKLKSILGSLVYQTPEDFHYPGETKRVMGYNNGIRSFLSLDYPIEVLRNSSIHESLHQITHNIIFDSILGRNVTHAGVEIYQYDAAGNYIGKYMEGLNESITEFFTKLSMGREYRNSSGYWDGVISLKYLVDEHIVPIDKLKKFYFTNDSTGLYNILKEKLWLYDLDSKTDDLVEAFDNMISNDLTKRKNGIDVFNAIIFEYEKRRRNGMFF